MKKNNLYIFLIVLLTILGVIWLGNIVTNKPITISPYNILLDSNRNVTNISIIERKQSNINKIDTTILVSYILEGNFKSDSTSIKEYILHFIDTSKFRFPIPHKYGGGVQIEFYKTSSTTQKDKMPDEYNTNLNEDLVAELHYVPPIYNWRLLTFSSGRISGNYDIDIDMKRQKVISVIPVKN